jgi:malate dehydrogenase
MTAANTSQANGYEETRMKVAVIGAGNVGATVAQNLIEADLADVVMLDVVEGVPQGKALDLAQSGAVLDFGVKVSGTNDYKDIAGASVVVVTAGFPRKPGMSRDELVSANRDVVAGVSREIRKHAPDSIVIMITNPLDAMCYVAMKETGFPRTRVIGMAGVLDSARFQAFIAAELGVRPKDVSAMVLGGHGDSMVPLLSHTTVGGVPVTDLIGKDRLAQIVERTRNGGAEIVKLLGRGSAYYAPGAAAFLMVDAIVKDVKRLLPASVWAQGEYGIRDTFVGLPVILGRKGVDKVVEMGLSADEKRELVKSADAVREIISTLK